MEVIKRRIPAGRGKCKATMQLTLDDDFNVPDRKPDVRMIVASQGTVHTNEVVPSGEKVQLDGVLQFQVLYISEQNEGRMQGMSGEIPFREWVNLPEECQGAVLVRWVLEDLSVDVINSRKISVRAIVTAQVQGEESATEEVVLDLMEKSGEQCLKGLLPLSGQRIMKKDTFRVKEEYVLPSSRPDLEEVVYQETALRGVEVRLLEDKLSVKGELHFLIFYYGVDSDKLQYLELETPFAGTLDCIGASSDMVPDVEVSILKKEVLIKPDEDGEERILDMDVILELSIKIYGEENLEVLEDCYRVDQGEPGGYRELTPVYRELELQELVGHHSNKLRLAGRIPVPEQAPGVLQLCGTSGAARVDEVVPVEEGLRVEGVIELPILYLSALDHAPVYQVHGLLPFAEIIPVGDFREGGQGQKAGASQSTYEVRPVIDQVVLSLLDGREIDAKATLNLETYFFRKGGGKVVVDLMETEALEEEWQQMPGLIGYYVQPGDTQWSIGRKYLVPMEELPENPEPGARILIRKKHLAG